jgi:hypothetical protein
MKRVGLRIASVVLALYICFAASANARAPVSYVPASTHGNGKALAQVRTTLTITTITITTTLTTFTLRPVQVPHSLEHADVVAQFDATT